MGRFIVMAALLLLCACDPGRQSGSYLRLSIRNLGSEPLSRVQVDGGENLIKVAIPMGASTTIYFAGRDPDDCVHTVVVTSESATEHGINTNICAIEGLSIADRDIDAF